ncbi:putative histidine kinase/HSP90-like ATPase superfamily [Helianthus annuus]|nr:putative histidine kinase/HSP90-like ATPase superfamily [Helianthus annuus]KAJ0563889.1 putative histidine kinase/HSP90-like ATPase superfamily [Helianthus annuus]KAJ0731964.1 putative histidine kinase/HSP90-like ATPase superfamily [Helianthus annuus]
MTEFNLQQIFSASLSQVMSKSNIMGIQVVNNIAEYMLSEKLYGDSVRLQQVFAHFLSLLVSCTPPGGVIAIAVNLTKDQLDKLVQVVNLELRWSVVSFGTSCSFINERSILPETFQSIYIVFAK